MALIGITDYGMGNLRSVEKALQKAGARTAIITTADQISSCDKLVVPGVGAFGDAMANLTRSKLAEPVKEFIKSGKYFLGICLGMQILVEKSCEKGEHAGLGIIIGEVKRFPNGQKIPQIGWNQVSIRTPGSPLFEHVPDNSYFYFVHSYYVDTPDTSAIAATADYGISYACALCTGTVFGVQFHPEKSQKWGLLMLENFVNL